MNTKHTVLLDLDGTLIDSTPVITAAMRQVLLRDYGIERSDTELRKYIGPPMTWTTQDLFGSGRSKLKANFVAAYRELYTEMEPQIAIFPGVTQMLSELRENGYVLALATSKPLPLAQRILNGLHMTEQLDVISGSNMAETLTKADVVRMALAETDCSPDSAVMVGDRIFDMEGASEVGVPAIGCGWSELATAGEFDYAFATATTPADIPPILEQLWS